MQGVFGLIDCIKDRKVLINWGAGGKIPLSAVGVGRLRRAGIFSFLTIIAPLLCCPVRWLDLGTGDVQSLKLLSSP